jgi:hypothetical protein
VPEGEARRRVRAPAAGIVIPLTVIASEAKQSHADRARAIEIASSLGSSQ